MPPKAVDRLNSMTVARTQIGSLPLIPKGSKEEWTHHVTVMVTLRQQMRSTGTRKRKDKRGQGQGKGQGQGQGPETATKTTSQ